VFKDQHAPDRLLGADQLARLHQVGPRLPVLPQRGPASRRRLVGNELVQHLPQRGKVVLVHAAVEVLPSGADGRLGNAGHGDFRKGGFYDLGTGLSQTTGLPSVAPSVLPSGSASAASRALRIAAACARGSAVSGFST